MKKIRIPTQDEAGLLIAGFATIFGGWVRLLAPFMAGFPINDGGLFYVMMLAVQNNNYRLPEYVQYNGRSIPFAYPPFGFYVGALLSEALHVTPIEILRWLPALVSVAAIPAFYWLAKSILDSSFKAGIAAFIFAFIPRAMSWSMMGGGLTRSFGLLFLCLTLASVYTLLKKHDRKFLFASILFGTLTVLSHPEATIHTISFCVLIWAFMGRSKKGIQDVLFVGLGTIALTAPWWIVLIARFGLSPILAASQTGFHSVIAILIPIIFTLTDEPMMALIGVLGVIGFAMSLSQKKYLLPVAYILPFLIEPRSAPVYAMIPLAMLASLTLSDVILPAFAGMANGSFHQNRILSLLMIYLALYLVGDAFYFDTQFVGTTVSQADRKAFEWVRLNTAENSRFLVLTGEPDVFCDGTSEWFPALTGRASLTTVQGSEWLPGKFTSAVSTQKSIQGCLNERNVFGCLEEKIRQAGGQYEYIYIANQTQFKNMCRVIMPVSRGNNLVLALEKNNDYKSVYQTEDVSIFFHEH